MLWFAAIIDWFKNKMMIMNVMILVWSLILPYVMVYVLHTGPFLIEINDFVVV
jgi:hypothetical protein